MLSATESTDRKRADFLVCPEEHLTATDPLHNINWQPVGLEAPQNQFNFQFKSQEKLV